LLIKMGCNCAQGYLYAPAMSVDEFVAWWKASGVGRRHTGIAWDSPRRSGRPNRQCGGACEETPLRREPLRRPWRYCLWRCLPFGLRCRTWRAWPWRRLWLRRGRRRRQ
jgi:hypothetical protein